MRKSFVISFGQGGSTLSELFNKELFKLDKSNVIQFQSNIADGNNLSNPVYVSKDGTSTRIEAGYKVAMDNISIIKNTLDKYDVNNSKIEVFASSGGTGSGFASVIIPELLQRGNNVRLNFIWPHKIAERNPYAKNATSLFAGFKLGNEKVTGLYNYTRSTNDDSRLRVFVFGNDQALKIAREEKGFTSDSDVTTTIVNDIMLEMYKRIIMFPETHRADTAGSVLRVKYHYDAMQHREAMLVKGGGVIGYMDKVINIDNKPTEKDLKHFHDLNVSKISDAGDIAMIICPGLHHYANKGEAAEKYLISIRDFMATLNSKANRYFGIAPSHDNKDRLIVIGAQCSLNNLLDESVTVAIETAKRRADQTRIREIVDSEDFDILGGI